MTASHDRPRLRIVPGGAAASLEDEDTAAAPAVTGTPSGERPADDGERPRADDEEPPVCQPGEQYGDVVIKRFVTRGGMGEVYEVHHEGMDQRLAMKVLRRCYQARPDFVKRFREEGRTLAAICQKEPNVVQIRNVGSDPRCGPYITMEWLVGKTFAELIDAWGGSIPVAQAVNLVIRVADVTHRIHLLGLIYRDLKPANLFLERAPRNVPDAEPRLVVLDLGISIRAGAERTTEENRTLGTIDYMAPEQIQFGRATAASDQYALGHTLYEMLKEHAFARAMVGADDQQRYLLLMAAHLFGEIERLPTSVAPDARDEAGRVWSLSAILVRAMQREPGDRYPSMDAFADDLRGWLAAHRTAAARPTDREPIPGLRQAVEAAPLPSHRGPHELPRHQASPALSAASSAGEALAADAGGRQRIAPVEFSAMVSGCSLMLDFPSLGQQGPPIARYPVLGAVIRIGRDADQVDLLVEDDSVSRVHCEMRHVVPGVFQVVDLGSTHGLVLDGLEAREGILRQGKSLVLGRARLRLLPPGGFRRDASGKDVFVGSAMELPPHERATVRMVGSAAAPHGATMDTAQFVARLQRRPSGSPVAGVASGGEARVARATPTGEARAHGVLYYLGLTLLVAIGAAAVFWLAMAAREHFDAKPMEGAPR